MLAVASEPGGHSGQKLCPHEISGGQYKRFQGRCLSQRAQPDGRSGRGNPVARQSATCTVARRTEKESSPEKTRWSVRLSAVIHLAGKSACSPGPTSHLDVK